MLEGEQMSVFMCVAERLLDQLRQGAVFGGLGGVGLGEVGGFGFQRFVESENVVDGDQVDDPRRRHAVDLVLKDVADPVAVVRKRLFHLRAFVKAFDDFGDIEPRFHVEVGERFRRIVETAGIFFLEQIDHHLHHPFRREDLVRLLRRDVVEDVLGEILVEIVRQFLLLP